jgi:hypothetical protein
VDITIESVVRVCVQAIEENEFAEDDNERFDAVWLKRRPHCRSGSSTGAARAARQFMRSPPGPSDTSP